jgi:YidC/Oxa1 family membrane protein insertase
VNPLKILEDPLRGLLDFLHDQAHLTYGWSIVVLTLIVRTILLPLVIKQYRSMRRMAVFAPQIKELQAKYKGDRQKQQEEMMKFYKENQINPFASCLPLVAQIPVFIALYYVLRGFASHASGSDLSFMWIIPNVSEQLTDIGWGAIPLAIIYGLSQLLSTELSATPNMPAVQRKIMRFLPIVIVAFVFQFPVPAGLVIYWLTTNLWTCGQQLVMRRMIGHHPALAPGTAPVKTSRTPPKEVAAATAGASDGGGETSTAPSSRQTPRKRRRGARVDGATANGAPPTEAAPQEAPAQDAAAPAEEAAAPVEPDVVSASEPEPEAQPAPEPAGPKAGASPNGAGQGAGKGAGQGQGAAKGTGGRPRSGGGGAARRRPRPKGQGASQSRRPPKKRR